jgi:putative component of membrane protein insertase Oxa1/YidC/SpoIIIJ protein YidD
MLRDGIDSFLCAASVSAIAWYQVVLSPRKGFACPYRVLTGGESCSQFARHVFETESWWLGLRAVIARFRLCAGVARALRRHGVARAYRVRDESFDGGPTEQKTEVPEGATDNACDPGAGRR